VGTLRLLLIFSLFCGSAAAAGLRVAAAANLNQVLPELITAFEQSYPDIRVKVSYGASGTLSQQISRGAPYEVFISASPKYVDYLENLDLVARRQPFALGRLVLFWSRRLDPPLKDVSDLTRADVERVVVANPEHAPFGQAAIDCLRHYGVYEEVSAKLIYAANVSQAAQMALHGADAALIALPLARNPNMIKAGNYLDPGQECHSPLLQEVAVVKDTGAADRFLDFLSSPIAARILRAHGYDIP